MKDYNKIRCGEIFGEKFLFSRSMLGDKFHIFFKGNVPISKSRVNDFIKSMQECFPLSVYNSGGRYLTLPKSDFPLLLLMLTNFE
jgi:hypothetical protein